MGEALSQSGWAGGTAYRRLDAPRWPFVFRGLVPILALLAVTLFAVSRFAGYRIEQQTSSSLRAALDASGHSWARLSVSGQIVNLSGSAPTTAAGEDALRVARDANCPTWLGPKVCAISVSGAFATEASDGGEPAPVAISDAATCEESLAALLETERIEFASGSATIVSAAGPLLDRIAEVAGDCPGFLRIEGYTDSAGELDANQALSAARAEAVRDALGARGIPLGRLTAVGFGEANPIAANDSAAGRARNRRIEFHVTLDQE